MTIIYRIYTNSNLITGVLWGLPQSDTWWFVKTADVSDTW